MLVYRYFMMVGDAVVTVQQGVFRTNCIDCLDRTNVVQGMLAKKSLLEQLQVPHILDTTCNFVGRQTAHKLNDVPSHSLCGEANVQCELKVCISLPL